MLLEMLAQETVERKMNDDTLHDDIDSVSTKDILEGNHTIF